MYADSSNECYTALDIMMQSCSSHKYPYVAIYLHTSYSGLESIYVHIYLGAVAKPPGSKHCHVHRDGSSFQEVSRVQRLRRLHERRASGDHDGGYVEAIQRSSFLAFELVGPEKRRQ